MTAWPALSERTAGPASTTNPSASLPGMCTVAESPRPKTGTGRPRAAKLVLKLGPLARTETRTRPASAGVSSGSATGSQPNTSAGGP